MFEGTFTLIFCEINMCVKLWSFVIKYTQTILSKTYEYQYK